MPERDEGGDNLLQSIRADVHRILKFIEGDGTNDNPGWKVRLDRLEQSAKRRETLIYALGVPITMLIIERVVHYVSLAPSQHP